MADRQATGAKEWECAKCARTYSSPITITAVSCGPCSKTLGRKTQWMQPKTSSPS